MNTNWIEVDRAGLAQIIADRPKSFLLFELIQNALDEDVTEVDVWVESGERGRHAITVTDDSPDGYQDIRHAWTLYAPSKKKGDPELRGRFNVGCKMVLALAVEARVISTKAAVEFTSEGRRNLRRRTERGTTFEGIFRMTLREAEEAVAEAMRLIPPDDVTVRVNGDAVPSRSPFVVCGDVRLPTVFADAEGNLRSTSRKTTIELHEPENGEPAMLFELGIPVVELDGDDPYHVNVLQRVPLNIDRDNVTPAYLRTIRVEVLNAAHDRLDEDQARSTWATEASEDERAEPKAVDTVLTQRFGEHRVAYDPSDPEANILAASKGFTVVPGGSLTKGQWRNAKAGEFVKPAGQVTPSDRVKSSPDGVPPIGESKQTEAMKEIAAFARFLWGKIEPKAGGLVVQWFDNRKLGFAGFWGDGGILGLNAAAIGSDILAWKNGVTRGIVELLIHEFAHEREGNHLAEAYRDELCRLAWCCLQIDAREFKA